MYTINGLQKNSVLYIPEETINLLPEELIGEIFCQLSYEDICKTRLVSRFWREVSIKQEVTALKSLLTENNTLIALPTVLPMLPGRKEQILNILKDLGEKVLGDLQLQAKNRQALNPIIFDLAKIYKDVDVAYLMRNWYEKSSVLGEIALKLMKCGNLDKALEVANSTHK